MKIFWLSGRPVSHFVCPVSGRHHCVAVGFRPDHNDYLVEAVWIAQWQNIFGKASRFYVEFSSTSPRAEFDNFKSAKRYAIEYFAQEKGFLAGPRETIMTDAQREVEKKIMAAVDVTRSGFETSHAAGPVVILDVDDDRKLKIYPDGEFYASICKKRFENGSSWDYAAEKNEIPQEWRKK